MQVLRCTCGDSEVGGVHLPLCPLYALYNSGATKKDFGVQPPKPWPRGDAYENLLKAAELYAVKNKDYANGYNDIGKILSVMFPLGLSLKTPEQFRRLSTFIMCVTKLQRYAVALAEGGHEDSARDLTVYSAMLQEQTT